MTVRLNVALSNNLNQEIDALAEKTETNKSDILRKALMLYLAAHEGKERGLKLGMADKDQKLETEFIGI